MEDITDADYMHVKRVCKDFEIKHFGEYYDLYLKSDTLRLADVFGNFRKVCLEIYQLDPAKVELELLTEIDVLLMVEKRTRGEICHSINRYAKATNKYLKDYDKDTQSSCLKYWDVNNLYGWAMSQKLPVDGFEWIQYILQFNENFIKSYSEENDERYFLEVDVQDP